MLSKKIERKYSKSCLQRENKKIEKKQQIGGAVPSLLINGGLIFIDALSNKLYRENL